MEQKLDVGTVFERVFAVYRDQFSLLVPAALVVFVPVAIVDGIVRNGGGVLLSLIGVGVGLVGTYWFQGMVVEAVRDIMDGRRDHTVGSLIVSVRPVVLTLIVAGILAVIGIVIGLVLLIVPGLYLLTFWALIAPVIVVERVGVRESFDRSRALVRDHGWQVFSVIVVLFLIGIVLTAITQVILLGVSDSVVGYSLASLITNVLVAPLFAIAASVMYFELKRLHGGAAMPGPPSDPAARSTEAPAPVPAPEQP